jgi:hypothetical protein
VTGTNATGYFANRIGPVPGAVPGGCLDVSVSTYNGHVGSLEIWPPRTSLAGISYPVSGTAAWQPLALQNGWAPVPRMTTAGITRQPPSSYVQGHIADLTGGISQYPAGGGFVGTLPAAARPQHDLYLFAGPNEYLTSPRAATCGRSARTSRTRSRWATSPTRRAPNAWVPHTGGPARQSTVRPGPSPGAPWADRRERHHSVTYRSIM